jgi:hypothetical protein
MPGEGAAASGLPPTSSPSPICAWASSPTCRPHRSCLPRPSQPASPGIGCEVKFHTKRHRAASGRKLTVTASVTIREPAWTGIARGTLSVPGGDIGFTFSIQAVWTAQVLGDGSRFVADGTQSVGVIEIACTGSVSPSTAALPPGSLVIDDSVSPPRYSLDVGSVWRNVVTAHCPGHGSTSVGFDVQSRLVVEGTVEGDGTAITGHQVVNGIAWEWALSSQL